MQADDQYLLEFLEQTHQLDIPIYQRKYSWTEKQCQQLLDDIERIGEANEKDTHFLGAIVFKSKYEKISKKTVIDGQQRITTLNLIIGALANYLYDSQHEEIDMDADELVDSYLVNPAKKGELYYKLFLTEDDKTTLIKIIDSIRSNEEIDVTEDDSRTVLTNYNFFRKNIKEDNAVKVYNGLSRLLIVYIELTELDNPQLIFESMNSTGLDLSQADLIRNYLLMGLDSEEQEKIYNTYWKKIEKLFEDKKSEVFDKFIRDYLTLDTGDAPAFRNIYSDFKIYSKNEKFKDVEKLVREIFTYSNYFAAIAFGKETDPELKEHLDSLKSMGYDVTYPFLLNLYRDYKENKLFKEDFIKIINLTECYLIRRLICGIPTASHNKTFAYMYKDLDKDNLLESYQVNLVLKESYRRMPNDEEFASNFAVKDIYNLTGRNKEYIFNKLENWGFDENHPIVLDKKISIEHIMPQNPNLCQEWVDDLGPNYKEIQKTYLHTIGNLTVTGCNPKLSDKPFLEKKEFDECGYRNTIFRLSKDYLAHLDTWNEEEINKRANKLILRALNIWEYPVVSQEIIDKYVPKESLPESIINENDTEINLFEVEYWTKFNQHIAENSEILKPTTARGRPIHVLGSGNSLVELRFTFNSNNEISSRLHIKDNKELFDYLFNKKQEIENEFGHSLEWDRTDDLKSSQIRIFNYEIDFYNKEEWGKYIEWQVEMGERFIKVFLPIIEKF